MSAENTMLIAVDQTQNDTALSVASAGTFLPRIKLCQGQAKEVNQRKVARGGNFALVVTKEEVIDLGEEVVMVVCAGRAKALETGDMILTNFDPKSPEFKRIELESKDKDSGCMFGPEYLVWLPEHKMLATLFLCSPTARREGAAVHARLGRGALLTSKLIETEKYSWFGPVCKDYTSPIAELPNPTDLQEAIERFRNERSSEVRAVESPEGDRER
jgi:hypothetical protein